MAAEKPVYDEVEFTRKKAKQHLTGLNYNSNTLNAWDVNWRRVYRFSPPAEEPTQNFSCSFLKICYSEEFQALDSPYKGGFIHRPCTETFRSREELNVHALLHHYDAVVKRVEVKATELMSALKNSFTGRAFHVGIQTQSDVSPNIALPVTCETGRYFEDRLVLHCRTCPYQVDCAFTHCNFTYLAGHLPVSAGLSYAMIKKLFLNPADPQAEYMYQDPTRHRLSPLEKQNHNGKIRAMFVEKPVSFTYF